MNPMFIEAAAAILRAVMQGAAAYLVEHGIWTQAQSSVYVAATAIWLLSVGWSIWEKYKSRLKLVTALTMPAGTTEDAVVAKIASGVPVPTVATPPNTVPGVPK